MIGKHSVDVSGLSKYRNVHFLGRKQYGDLPTYCKGFAAGLIPFAVNELTRNVNPIKLREYLSAGVGVVSTAMPEVAYYRDVCVVASNYEEFEQGIAKVIAEDTPELRRQRSEAMRSETWEQRVAELGAKVMAAYGSKRILQPTLAGGGEYGHENPGRGRRPAELHEDRPPDVGDAAPRRRRRLPGPHRAALRRAHVAPVLRGAAHPAAGRRPRGRLASPRRADRRGDEALRAGRSERRPDAVWSSATSTRRSPAP